MFVSPLARLAFCQPDVCHMQAVSQPPCSTSLHALCAHSDPSVSVVAEEEVFLIVCIPFTTILLQGINVFSCSRALLVTKQNKQKIHHFPNSLMPRIQQQERGGKSWRGKEGEDGLHQNYFCPVQVGGQRQLNIELIKAGEQGRRHEPQVSQSKQ